MPLESPSVNFPEPSAEPQAFWQEVQTQIDRAPDSPEALDWLESCGLHLQNTPQFEPFLNRLLDKAEQPQYRQTLAPLDRLIIRLAVDRISILFRVLHRLQQGCLADRLEGIQVAERCLELATTQVDRIIAMNELLSGLIYANGDWQRAIELYQDYKTLLHQLVQTYAGQAIASPAEASELSTLAPIGSLFAYFEDNPRTTRPLRNQIAQIAQLGLQTALPDRVQRYRSRPVQTVSRSPRIGYLAGSLKQHSVGWLCRWLLHYHDRDRFEIHLYTPRPSADPIQQAFRQLYGDRFHDVPASIAEIADRIYDDQIDILVELDSLTSFGGCGVVALKPAPIQVHWLGYDASGIPGVDYFIADPYVLPADAQDYYSEKIWRLPQTYIAVDGFEVYTPALRRDRLGIPGDAVVFLSSQTGLKRNLDNVRLQIQIIKAVPDSYFLVKSFTSDPELTEAYFRSIAAAEGVSGDRLRFLPDVPSEFVHRANLALADVVLDTYPYNGATTTLEALWMGLPIVTRVGEQFAARNSYTMMMNVGVTEGLAWNDAEYLDWGIRLGIDRSLRQAIQAKLQRSRHSSPLWNGQAFARSMEQAYEQMWQAFQSG